MFKLQKYKKYFIQGNNFHISDQIQRNIQLSSRFENFSYLWLAPTLLHFGYAQKYFAISLNFDCVLIMAPRKRK